MDISLNSIIGYVEKNLDYFQNQHRESYLSNLKEVKDLLNREGCIPKYLISRVSFMSKEIYLKLNRDDLFKKINEF